MDKASAPPMYPTLEVAPVHQQVPMAQPAPQVVIIQDGINYGPEPVTVTCTNCGSRVVTRTEAQNGRLTWIACIALCFSIPFCFCLPFCCNSCQDIHHKCPSCKQPLGYYRRC